MENRRSRKDSVGKVVFLLFVIVILIIAAFVLERIGSTIPWTDKAGFRHSIADDGFQDQKKGESLDHVVVKADKEEFKSLDAHGFIEKVKPVLFANNGKKYVTFDFGDGTGLFFPEADISLDASYGEIDDTGTIISREGYIMVAGTQVDYEPISSDMSKESTMASDVLPKEYRNDDLSACIDDRTLYVNVARTALNREAADKIANEVAEAYLDCGFNKADADKFYIALNYKYGYRVDIKTGKVTGDDSVVEVVGEKNRIVNTEEF